ncbi:DUF4153 domain-containing protein [Pseudoruegeria sp. HB172150]|uniref:DUF4153 domain-containing protein n=1 Tax=Pseudoruegeria sp. HB172150 TaxID=2721164 RepID=UPI0015577551|nr:DUF4153 domain-containing protein [Pseudoruegeria sp. HB172150]
MTAMTEPGEYTVNRRVWMTAIGALAGLAAWLLWDVLPDHVENERLLLFLSAGASGFFAALLAAAGALALPRAVLAAAGASLPAACLLTWASLRYADVDDFLETGHAVFAYGLIVFLSLPFLIVALRSGEGWRSYPALFRQSWDIAVRYAAALVFVGIFWGVIFLSDALFKLVGLEIIEDLLEIDAVPAVLTGAIIGLALAVVAELADYISPFLILRLLRLLLPVVVVVAGVFLIAIPFRGLSDVFGGLSAAAVLLSMAVGIATLITSAIERNDEEAADSRILLVSAQLLAVVIPILSALALYAVWIRVADYGWSPDRIAATCAGIVGLGYGLLYAVSVIRRRDWMERIRQANIVMALITIALAALWLTPILNAERISARNQMARFDAGKVAAEDLDLWFLGREIGVAGEAAIAELAAIEHPEADVIAERLALLEAADSRYAFERTDTGPTQDSLREEILVTAPVVPEGGRLPDGLLDRAAPYDLQQWAEACREKTPAGNPACLFLAADLDLESPGDETLLVWKNGPYVYVTALKDGTRQSPAFLRGGAVSLQPQVIDDILAGNYSVGVPSVRSLDLGKVEIFIIP